MRREATLNLPSVTTQSTVARPAGRAVVGSSSRARHGMAIAERKLRLYAALTARRHAVWGVSGRGHPGASQGSGGCPYRYDAAVMNSHVGGDSVVGSIRSRRKPPFT